MVFGDTGGASGSASRATRRGARTSCTSISSGTLRARTWYRGAAQSAARADCGKRTRNYSADCAVTARLEALFRDAQHFEFTVQERRLYLLQTRAAKRTSLAALRIACEQVKETDRRGGWTDPTRGHRPRSDLDSAGDHNGGHRAGGHRHAGKYGGRGRGSGVRPAAVAATGRLVILIRAVISTDDIGGLAAAAGPRMPQSSRGSSTRCASSAVANCESPRRAELPHRRAVDRGGRNGLTRRRLDRVYVGALEMIREAPTVYLAEAAW
jgi:pyruvate, orthophosphate dikinase